MHNDGLKIKIFEFLAVVGQFKLKKKTIFIFLIFLCNTKKFP